MTGNIIRCSWSTTILYCFIYITLKEHTRKGQSAYIQTDNNYSNKDYNQTVIILKFSDLPKSY